ncbi:MAG: MGMT family protein [Bacteroidales bacterium]|nr:MGMT family protein [Bacteroidales bacterium]
MKAGSKKDFFELVWEVVKKIPQGRVTTYGAIARYLGSGLSARVVGYALNASKRSKDFIPAHRVVNRNGVLTGKHHFGSQYAMETLLRMEGIEVENDQIVRFKELLWDPLEELKNE